MSDRLPASAARKLLTFLKGSRPRALVVMLALAASAFMWPGLLQTEQLPGRAETLKVLGPAADTGGGGAPVRGRRHKLRPRPRGFAAAPKYGALRESPPHLDPPGFELAALSGPPSAELQKAIALAQEPPTAPPSDPFVLPQINNPEPFPGGPVGGPGPGPPGPGTPEPPVVGPNPPITNPPVTNPPVTNPPVTNPPVTNPPDPGPPVVDPGLPPVVGPPPVVAPPPVTEPGPPIVDNPIPPGDPGGPGGGGPGGGGPGGGGPPPGVPEPSVWLELVLGAGLAGAYLRRARTQPAAIALRAFSRLSTTT